MSTTQILSELPRLSRAERREIARRLVDLEAQDDSAAFEKTSGETSLGSAMADKPWLALRNSAQFIGDPFAPVIAEEDVIVLQKEEGGTGL